MSLRCNSTRYNIRETIDREGGLKYANKEDLKLKPLKKSEELI